MSAGFGSRPERDAARIRCRYSPPRGIELPLAIKPEDRQIVSELWCEHCFLAEPAT
jgi:hypothetical protein